MSAYFDVLSETKYNMNNDHEKIQRERLGPSMQKGFLQYDVDCRKGAFFMTNYTKYPIHAFRNQEKI